LKKKGDDLISSVTCLARETLVRNAVVVRNAACLLVC
jgi:hypothetical protein